jgi:hypothetical protein
MKNVAKMAEKNCQNKLSKKTSVSDIMSLLSIAIFSAMKK